MRKLLLGKHIPQSRLRPQPLRKGRVVDLEAIIHTYGLALPRPAGSRCKREGAEEGDIGAAEGAGEEVGEEDDFVWKGRVRSRRERDDRERRFEGGP